MFIAGSARDHDIAAVHPHPLIVSRYEVGIAMMTVLAAQFLRDPDPLAHRDPAREGHVTVAQVRKLCKCEPCLFEQNFNTLPCNLLGHRIFGSLFHCLVTGSRLCYTISVPDKIVVVYLGRPDHIGFFISRKRRSKNPDLSPFNDKPVFAEEADRFREDNMLLFKDPFREIIFVIGI